MKLLKQRKGERMKFKNIIFITMVAALSAMMTGCAVLDNLTHALTPSSENETARDRTSHTVEQIVQAIEYEIKPNNYRDSFEGPRHIPRVGKTNHSLTDKVSVKMDVVGYIERDTKKRWYILNLETNYKKSKDYYHFKVYSINGKKPEVFRHEKKLGYCQQPTHPSCGRYETIMLKVSEKDFIKSLRTGFTLKTIETYYRAYKFEFYISPNYSKGLKQVMDNYVKTGKTKKVSVALN
jgi:hypothetical protein